MNILQPYYYEDFECIGGKCKDSCCIGWRVAIDKKSFNKYTKVKGEFSDTIKKNIKKVKNSKNEYDYGEMILNEDKRCRFLNTDNLCDIYINLGEESLCYTCTVYPRSIYKYGDIVERNLTLSCPKVAEYLVNTTEPFGFVMKDDDINDVEKQDIIEIEFNENLYNLLWEGRSFSMDIAQFREIPLWKRLIFIKITEKGLQKLIDSGNYDGVVQVIEKLRNEITDQNVIDSLELGSVNNLAKINTVSGILGIEAISASQNKTFRKVLNNYNEFVENRENENLQIKLEEANFEFEKYFKNKEYILENYIVYNLYSMYMKGLKTRDLDKEINRLIISYSIIKMFLISTWVKNDYKLTDDDIIEILYSFSRNLEHNEELIQAIYIAMKDQGLDSIANLVTLLY